MHLASLGTRCRVHFEEIFWILVLLGAPFKLGAVVIHLAQVGCFFIQSSDRRIVEFVSKVTLRLFDAVRLAHEFPFHGRDALRGQRNRRFQDRSALPVKIFGVF